MASTWDLTFSWRSMNRGIDADCASLWLFLEDLQQSRWIAGIYDDSSPTPDPLETHNVSNGGELRSVAERGYTVVDFAQPPVTWFSLVMHTPGVLHRVDANLGCNVVVPFEPNIQGIDGAANSLWLHVKGGAAPTHDAAAAYFFPLFQSCVRRFGTLLIASLNQGDDTTYYPKRVRSSKSVSVPSPGFMFYINREHYDPLPPLGDDARVVDIDGKGSLVILNHEPWSMENDAVFEAIERVDLTLQKAGVMRQPKYLRGYVPDENLPGWPVPPDKRGFFDV